MEDATQWKDAIVKELQALIDMGTWELVKLPKGRKAVGCQREAPDVALAMVYRDGTWPKR